MKKLNKYWDISWWYIFNFIDEKCHKIAIDLIWECKTSNVKIDYLKPIEKINDLYNWTKIYSYVIWNNKVYFQVDIMNKVFASLLFIKI